MLFAIHALDKPGALEVRLERYAAHKAFLQGAETHGVRLVMSGPLTSEDGATMIGSLLIVEAQSHEIVERFNQADPFHMAGIWAHVSITGFIRRQG